jgi:small subunit ribosomal protein S2
VSVVSMRELLEAGVHFGHQTRRWNPKMRRFIFTERGGIYIIDLQQTLSLLEEAYEFARNIASRGGSVLFVGTKKQAMDAVEEHAKRAGQPYVNHRWLGGLLTNWRTMSQRIERLHELRRLSEEAQLELLPAKERIAMQAELQKLEDNLGGVADMRRRPDAVFIIDLRKEQLAVREARRLGLPIIALVDTNADPDEADYIIPGNDDAIRSCELIVRAIAAGIEAGERRVTAEEFAANGNGAAAEAEPPAPEAAPAAQPEAEDAEPAAQTEPETPAQVEAAVEEPPAEVVAENVQMSSSERPESAEEGAEGEVEAAREAEPVTEEGAEGEVQAAREAEPVTEEGAEGEVKAAREAEPVTEEEEEVAQ